MKTKITYLLFAVILLSIIMPMSLFSQNWLHDEDEEEASWEVTITYKYTTEEKTETKVVKNRAYNKAEAEKKAKDLWEIMDNKWKLRMPGANVPEKPYEFISVSAKKI